MFPENFRLSVKVDEEGRHHLDLIYVVVLDRRSIEKFVEQLSVCSPPRPVRHESHGGFTGSHPTSCREARSNRTNTMHRRRGSQLKHWRTWLVKGRSAVEIRGPVYVSTGSYFVRIYGRTLVKEIRDGFAGAQHHYLHSRNFETKDISPCDSRVSKIKVLAREAREIAISYRVVWPSPPALPRGGHRVGNPGGSR